MKKTVLATAAAAAMAGLLSVTPAPAQAATFSFSFGNQMVGNFCSNHRYDRDCRDFYRGHRNWNESRYRSFAGRHGLSFGFDINVNSDNRMRTSGHIQRCEDRYRSYDRRTDQFLGFDGDYHYCTL